MPAIIQTEWSGNAQKASVIGARIHISRIEGPVVRGKDLEIGLDWLSPTPLITNSFYRLPGYAGHVWSDGGKLFGNADDGIRISTGANASTIRARSAIWTTMPHDPAPAKA